MVSATSTVTITLARFGGERDGVAVGEAEPLGVVGETRSAPRPSFLRHAGSRKMVLAVNERRSPAESRNGHSRVAARRRLVAQLVELGEQLGDAELHPAVGRC